MNSAKMTHVSNVGERVQTCMAYILVWVPPPSLSEDVYWMNFGLR
jgi:hypothetical protein